MEKEGFKPTEVDLSISNAQTNETFKNDQEMISKNSSVVILRTPLARRAGSSNPEWAAMDSYVVENFVNSKNYLKN